MLTSSSAFCIVEGKSDQWFLIHVAKTLGKVLTEKSFYVSNGYDSKYIEFAIPHIDEAKKKGLSPIIFVDADSNFTIRKQEIQDQLNAFNMGGIPYFIFPDNRSNGEIEDLIFKTIPPHHSSILSCFDQYNNCISGYTKANNKSKLFAYSEATNQLIKNNSIDFSNSAYWNLSQQNLPDLHKFLSTHL